MLHDGFCESVVREVDDRLMFIIFPVYLLIEDNM